MKIIVIGVQLGIISNIYTALISDRLERKLNCRKSLTPMQQLLAALNYYATGTFKKEVGHALRMIQSSVSQCTRRFKCFMFHCTTMDMFSSKLEYRMNTRFHTTNCPF